MEPLRDDQFFGPSKFWPKSNLPPDLPAEPPFDPEKFPNQNPGRWVELVGGPMDGQRVLSHKGRGCLALQTEPTDRAPEHAIAHWYAIDEETGKAHFLGKKSLHEIRVEQRLQECDDDEGEEWKKA